MNQLTLRVDVAVPLPSRLVPPQADSPEEIIAELEALAGGQKRQSRHGRYYRAAGRLLGLLTGDRRSKRYRLLAPGRALLCLPTLEARLARLALAFEESECGKAWARWQGVENILEVEPSSAEQFLSKGTTCEASTVGRRAQTLEAWCKKLLPHHPYRRAVVFAESAGGEDLSLLRPAIFATKESGALVRTLAPPTRSFRVATAFLTVQGYDLLFAETSEAKLRLLVGSEDACDSVETILRRFAESIEAGAPAPEKRELLRALHRRLVLSTDKVRCFEPKYAPRLHAKVYIFDARAAYVTSANLTDNGLRRSVEAGYLVRDRESITYFTEQFDRFFKKARPLLHELLERIERSWVFSDPTTPYLLYLRTLLELYGEVPDLADCTPPPLSEFQRMIVGSVLRVLKEQRGVLLVSPTGTGKTVMASHVAACLMDREIKRIKVFCPNQALKKLWEEHLKQVGQHHAQVITHGLIQRKGAVTKEAEERLADLLRQARDTDLVIIDECHAFRNRETNGFESLSTLLTQSQGVGRPRLLLLSATPLSKDLIDLNTLLKLLGNEHIGTIDDVTRARSIVNVTLPFIIKQFGTDDRGRKGRALRFGEQYRYFPKITGHKRLYTSSMEQVFERAAQMDLRIYLKKRKDQPPSETLALPGIDTASVTSARAVSGLLKHLLLRRAESSPLALRRSIECLRAGVARLRLSPVDPEAFTTGLTALEALIPEPAADTKLASLVELIKEQPRRRKILIFSMWSSTVEYLERELPQRVGPRRVSTITNKITFKEQQRRLRRFAPLAQKRPERRLPDDIDVLIATDIIAEGQNLQDAEVVVNYDLPWTPLLLIQRMGRVDRPTPRLREVSVWHLYPESPQFESMVRVKAELDRRSELYLELSRLDVVGDYERDFERIEAGDWGAVRLYFEGRDYEQILEDFPPTTHHLVALAKASVEDVRLARELPVGCRAAKAATRPGIFVLLLHKEQLHCVLREKGDRAEIQVSPDPYSHEALLVPLAAEAETPMQSMPSEMDRTLSELVKAWARARRIPEDELTVVCAEALSAPVGTPPHQ